MERWAGKVALVTGASSGIGAATAEQLVKHGMKVVAIARRIEKVEALKDKIQGPGELIAYKADVAKEEEVIATIEFIKSKFGSLHVLVNNAGVFRPGKVIDQDSKHLREVMEINVMGLTFCTKYAWKLMEETEVTDGHIININSIAGHNVTGVGREPLASIYPASKHAVTALTEILRQEFRSLGTKTKVTSISPGFVGTEIGEAGLTAIGEPKELFAKLTKNMPALNPKDIADGIIYALSTPPHVQVHELTIKPLGEMM